MSQDPKLTTILEQMSARARHSIDLDYLVTGWERLASEVGMGYAGNVYDYTNDLSKRDLLEDILIGAPGSLGQTVRGQIDKADAAYRDATRPVNRPLLPRTSRPDRWWWSRVPRVLVGELKSDLEGAGFLAEGGGPPA